MKRELFLLFGCTSADSSQRGDEDLQDDRDRQRGVYGEAEQVAGRSRGCRWFGNGAVRLSLLEICEIVPLWNAVDAGSEIFGVGHGKFSRENPV